MAASARGRHTQAEANRRYFESAYRTGQHGWPETEASPYVLRFLSRVREAFSGGRLLDLGCGEGRHCLAAAKLGFQTVGLDYEPLALARARHLIPAGLRQRVTLCVGDVLNLPFEEAAFDVVLDYGCLHHQRKADWRRYRANLLRALKPHGFYILSVFSPRFHLFRGSSRPWHLAHGAYRRWFSHEEMLRLWEKDFELLDLIEERDNQRGMWHALFRRR